MVNIVNAFIRGFERPIMLWLLSFRPRHGYELMKEFKRLTGQKLKPSIVYPFLHWLEKEGFAVSSHTEKGKRRVKCYSLTERGQRLLRNTRSLFNKSIREVIHDLISEE